MGMKKKIRVTHYTDMGDNVVVEKANAAAVWCKRATDHGKNCGGKPWSYLLIPHDQISEQMTFS